MEKEKINNEFVEKFFDNIKNIVKASDVDSKISIKEEDFLFNNNTSDLEGFIRLEELKIRIKKTDSHRDMREKNAKLAFLFSAIWAGFIAVVILLYGFGSVFNFFKMSQSEFMFIIGSLTFSILAFYTIVLTFLFKAKKCNCSK